MKNKTLFILLGLIVVTGSFATGGWFLLRASPASPSPQASLQITAGDEPISTDSDISENQPSDSAQGELSSDKISTLLNVPFTSQAPLADWDNIIFQQGCEEASMLMAMFWVGGKKLIFPAEAEKAILSMSSFEQKNYGEFKDTSGADTVRWAKDYFDYENIEVKNDIDTHDIKAELVNGNLVIVPVNGQKLGNPFYTPPGPLQHMIVVVGYDADKKEFITNDPGTRRGEAFRYKGEVLEGALQDYATGYKEPITEVRKVMIVIGG